MLSAAIRILGFDPIQLAGIPSEQVLLYSFVLTASLAVGLLALRPLRPSRRKTAWLVVAVLIGAFGASFVRTDLTKEYTNTAKDLDGGLPPRPVVVPLPLPGLRSPEAKDHGYGGKFWEFETYEPLQEFVYGPENIVATYATMALQLIFLSLAVVGSVALTTEAGAAILQSRRSGRH